MIRSVWIPLFAASLFAADESPAGLVTKSIEATQTNGTIAKSYTYQEHRVVTDLDSHGKPGDVESDTWDIIALEGSTYRKLIAKNEKPLSAKDQKKEDERLLKETERRKKESGEERKRRIFSYNYNFGLPYRRLNEIYSFRALPDERIGEYSTKVVEGTARPDFQPRSHDEKESVNYALKLWLDDKDFYPVRISGEVVGEHSQLRKGTSFQIDFAKVNGDAWLAQRNAIHFVIRPLRLMTARGDQVITYSNFRKFQVDSKLLADEGR